MPKARNPVTVINAILAQLPAEECDGIRKDLEILRDAAYHPPEYQRTPSVWEQIVDVLESTLSMPPVHEWEKAIDNIMKGRKPNAKH
jgi:hypothetical protein